MNRRILVGAGLLAYGLAVFAASTIGRFRPEVHVSVVGLVVILTFFAVTYWRPVPPDGAELSDDYVRGYADGLAHRQIPEGSIEDYVRGHADGWVRKPLPRQHRGRLTVV